MHDSESVSLHAEQIGGARAGNAILHPPTATVHTTTGGSSNTQDKGGKRGDEPGEEETERRGETWPPTSNLFVEGWGVR